MTTENTKEKRKVKKYNEHSHTVELNELTKKALPLIAEQRQILKEVNAPSLAEFEAMLNLKTSFVNANLSAQALGKEIELKRLQELEVELNKYNVTDDNVTSKGDFKPSFLNSLKEKYTIYFTKEEEEAREELEEVMARFNAIPQAYRKLIGFNYSQQLGYTPFANLHL